MQRVDPFRFQFGQSLTAGEIELLVADPQLRAIQCSSPVKAATWELLNHSLFARRPEIHLRVYGFYDSLCDLEFVKLLPNVRHFAANNLMHAEGVEHLGMLQKLESLSIGIYSLENFDFLADVPKELTKLALSATKSKKPGLVLLKRFEALKTLYLDGQQKGIEALAKLHALEDLTLRSVSPPNLNFLKELTKLWTLDIKLGGIKDFSAIENKETIKYLELWQVRGLSDLSFISTLYGLQFLFLQSLRNVTKLPDLSNLTRLRRVWLEDLKGLVDVSSLEKATSLEEFVHVSAQNMQPDQYRFLLQLPLLKRVAVRFGSAGKNDAFDRMVFETGRELFERRAFVFN